ncbi:MAG: hypothetical protein LBB88_07700 [Planctomycetaceae bacterium]|jgi:hypothetical protein|nr:hypothetical protein [Planctomycetaceae bacterium]
MNRAGLIFSHFPKQISGLDEPIRRLKLAVEFLRSQNVTLVTSAGQTQWDCILTAALNYGLPVHLVVALPMTIAEVSEQFLHEFKSYDIVESREARDKFICETSDCLYPLWIRRGGRFSKIIDEFLSRVDSRFDCSSYRFRDSGLKYLLSEKSAEIDSAPHDYLWHWTRGKHGAWTNETRRNYCNDILNSESPPRDALATLIHILQEQKIRASGLHIAGNIPVTAFTSNHPAKSEPMFTWRKNLQQMNFEPYGIGIPQEIAIEKGAKLLNYGTTPNWDTMQFKNRWKYENEWRIKNDFLIDQNYIDKIIVVVRKRNEIKQVQKFFKGKIIAFEK